MKQNYGTLKLKQKIHPRKYQNSDVFVDIPIYSCSRNGKRIRLKKIFDNIYTDSHDDSFVVHALSGELVSGIICFLSPVVKNILAKNITEENFIQGIFKNPLFGIKDYVLNLDSFRLFYIDKELSHGYLIKNNTFFYEFEER